MGLVIASIMDFSSKLRSDAKVGMQPMIMPSHNWNIKIKPRVGKVLNTRVMIDFGVEKKSKSIHSTRTAKKPACWRYHLSALEIILIAILSKQSP